jgi:hypothetical protein
MVCTIGFSHVERYGSLCVFEVCILVIWHMLKACIGILFEEFH